MKIRNLSCNPTHPPANSSDRWERLEHRLAATESRLSRAERRLGVTWGCAFAGIVVAFVLGLSPDARAQFGVTLSSLNNRLTAVETKTQFVSVSEGQMLVTGTNLHIRNGLGATNGNPAAPLSTGTTSVNGLGNLVIGYNEASGPQGDERGGSHNLVVSNLHDYTSFGGMVAGQANRILGPFANVSGGTLSTASGDYASVSGGEGNTASGDLASVSGGQLNVASGFNASVSGGRNNQATGNYSSVSSGQNNRAAAFYASVSGGFTNLASGDYASVSGGANNTAGPGTPSVFGGDSLGSFASVSGGKDNFASGDYASVSGGANNLAGLKPSVRGRLSLNASVSGGRGNYASGDFSSVSGGQGNQVRPTGASVSGGLNRILIQPSIGIDYSYTWQAGNLFANP